MKKLSIILPTYNIERYIEQTLNSILKQTYRNLEVIIIDDCSTDNTRSILKNYSKKDDRIKLFLNESNLGPGATRNSGIEKATGEYITFMDHDDWQNLDRYENMISILERDKTEFVLSYANEYTEETKELKSMHYVLPEGVVSLKENREKLYRHFIPPWRKVYKTEFIRKNGIKFAENGVKFDDLLFQSLLIYSTDRFSVYRKESYTHRIFSKSITAKYIKDRKLLNRERVENYRQALNLETPVDKEKLAEYYFLQIKLKRIKVSEILFLFKSAPKIFCKIYFKKTFKI